jgi:hypothetical protein
VDHAAELAGGADVLAQRLGVRSSDVVAWVSGTACPASSWRSPLQKQAVAKARKNSQAV